MRRRLPILLLAVPLLAACGTTTTKTVISTTTAPVASSSTTPTTSSPVTPTTSTAAAAVFFHGAAGPTQQRPASLQLTGDGTLAVERVQWSTWGGPTAIGTGNAFYHGCTPNCASAPTHTALVAIRLSSVRSCSGRSYYSGVTLTLNSGQLLDKDFLQQSWAPC
jgi:hypothetical protein